MLRDYENVSQEAWAGYMFEVLTVVIIEYKTEVLCIELLVALFKHLFSSKFTKHLLKLLL